VKKLADQSLDHSKGAITANPLHAHAEAISLCEAIRTLDEAGNRVVRAGIRNNLVTFPSEVPVFKKSTRPDLQAKMALLYFVRGWSMAQIGERYNLGRQRVAQIVTRWRIRAVVHGYVQVVNEASLVPGNFVWDASDRNSARDGSSESDSPRYDPVTLRELYVSGNRARKRRNRVDLAALADSEIVLAPTPKPARSLVLG
jgi:hypothetical protein